MMQTSALALCYSTAEYCAPIWCRSSHTKLVDAELHSTMRTVTRLLRPTPLPWLLVLSNIAPPHIRHEEASAKVVEKIRANPQLPVHKDLFDPPRARLSSRCPLWCCMPRQTSADTMWREEWSATEVCNHFLVTDPTARPPEFNQPRQIWTLLNRFRTGQGQCAANLHRWGQRDDPLCECGQQQTMTHIVSECPLIKPEGGLKALRTANETAVTWLDNLCIC
nr:PREDICTED: uncharacterized protein LOC106705349 [Latimeria chalumnae]|eukprot:XP_014350022.1 PREDICTED: uncharacterized protein LOC106705349 [Latimeria chalumnae]